MRCGDNSASTVLRRLNKPLIALLLVFALPLSPLASMAQGQTISDAQLRAVFLLLSNNLNLNTEDEIPPVFDAANFYAASVAGPVVEARCVLCHVNGGIAGNASLLFLPGDNDRNLQAISDYVASSGSDDLLAKIRGENHPGGTIFPAGSNEYEAVETLLAGLTPAEVPSQDINGVGFFDGVKLASPEETLRRAAIILAGRLPTQTELEMAVRDRGFRQAILGLMEGEGFHKFLLRGANDRLHTDAFNNGLRFELEQLDRHGGYQHPLGAARFLLPENSTTEQRRAREDFEDKYKVGLVRAPLELIAHVVENDRPYTEVLTADYTMVNRYTNEVYGSGVTFGTGSEALHDFRPGRNNGTVLRDASYRAQGRGSRGWEIMAHAPAVHYPHAGILTDPAWLNRYPSTETNRNRARARWTYYHFLGVDIEKSAPRTTDPEALADTDNPTRLNANCTVCHNLLDPLAGAYQNFGDEGLYRDFPGYRCNADYSECDVYGGTDSLPREYKFGAPSDNPNYPPYQPGDTWYRDMLKPGFGSLEMPSKANRASLQWLARQIAADPRFATAAVKFWWQPLMGRATLEAPVFSPRYRFADQVSAFDAQQREIASLGTQFSNGGYQLKSLLADMVMSPWFRAKSLDAGQLESRRLQLAGVGVDRLLTPEELEAKTEAVLGYAWDKREDDPDRYYDGYRSALDDNYRLYYGGIDSVNVLERNSTITALMSNVAERQALELSCGVASLEFITPTSERRVFRQVGKTLTPLMELEETRNVPLGSFTNSSVVVARSPMNSGVRTIRINFDNDAYNSDTREDRNLYIDRVEIYRNDQRVRVIEGENFPNTRGFAQTSSGTGRVVRGLVGGNEQPVAWAIYRRGYVEFETTLPETGDYSIRVRGWGTESGDGVLPQMTLTISAQSTNEITQGSLRLQSQIRDMYQQMLGPRLPMSDPEIQSVYQLLTETWLERQTHDDNHRVSNSPYEECLYPRSTTSEERAAGLRDDPEQMVYAWSTVLYYFLTHFDYLHE